MLCLSFAYFICLSHSTEHIEFVWTGTDPTATKMLSPPGTPSTHTYVETISAYQHDFEPNRVFFSNYI